MSLFSLCLEFVATNIHLVESFVGFPDSIGNRIFHESVRKRQFVKIKDSDEVRANLKVFFDAYGAMGILESLCLRQSHLFVNDALNGCPWLLNYLTSLDLSSCGLGDNHEILPQITTLHKLEVLNIAANCLTNDGIRLLTTPLRFHQKSHSLLKYINLSANRVNARCLHFMKIFKELCAIDVSNTCIHEQIATSRHADNFLVHRNCSCCDSMFRVTSKGWAKDVVDNWNHEYCQCSTPSRSATSLPFTHSLSENTVVIDAKSFYSRRKPASSAVSTHSENEQAASSSSKLILVTNLFQCSSTEKTSSNLSFSSPLKLKNNILLCSDSCEKLLSSKNISTKTFPNSPQIHCKDNGLKRKAKSSSSQDKRFCFQKDKPILNVKETVVKIPKVNFQREIDYSTSISSAEDDFDITLAFYSKTGEDKVAGTGNVKCDKYKRKRSLVEELEDLF